MLYLLVWTPADELAVIIHAPWSRKGLIRHPRAVNDP